MEHIFGTDELSRDIFSRILYASRISLFIGFAPTTINLIIGTFLGMIAGMTTLKWVDTLIMRIVDIVLSYPFMILAMAIVYNLGASTKNLFLALILVGWAGTARTVRAQTLSLKNSTYIEAARSMGVSKWKIMIKHILPNIRSLLLVLYTMSIPVAILSEAGLSFLGFGAQNDTRSIGGHTLMGLRQGVIELLHALAGRVGKGEKLLCDGIAEDLELEKYTVEQCYDGAKAYDLLLNEAFDLLILDLNLPGMDGLDLLRVARAEWPQLRVLILSARAGLSDRITGLDLGADDYLTKPFEPKELLACIRALTRRQPELRQTDALKYGDLRLEKTSFTLSCGERSVRLSRKEFDMMEMLMLNQKLVITKEKLLLKVWGYESDAEDNNVEVYISFLRKKLDHLHSQVKIRTIRMVGYCLSAPEA